MKKFITLSLYLILAVLFVSCSVNNNSMSKIYRKTNILNLVDTDNNTINYEFKVDEYGKSIHIKFYIIDDNLKWKEDGGFSSEFTSTDGNITINSLKDQKLQIAFQDKNGISTFVSNSDIYSDIDDKSSSLSWNDTTDIIYDKEIPLVIQTIGSKNGISTYGIDNYYNTDRLKEHDTVIAITVTFSKSKLE